VVEGRFVLLLRTGVLASWTTMESAPLELGREVQTTRRNGRPEHARDDQRVHDRVNVAVHVVVDTFRVGHILEHDVADMQGLLAEPELEQLDRA